MRLMADNVPEVKEYEEPVSGGNDTPVAVPISQVDYEEFKSISVSRTAYYLGYSTKLYLASKDDEMYGCTGNYIRKVKEAFDKGLIGEGKRNELLLDAYVSQDFQAGGGIVDD